MKADRTAVAIFEPCVGVGGGDGFCSSLIATAMSIDWTVFVEHYHPPARFESAMIRSRGRAKFFSVRPKKDLPLSPLVNWFDTEEEAALAAADEADVVISWHCETTPGIAGAIEVPIVELIQNQDEQAASCGRASLAYAAQRVAVSHAAGRDVFGQKSFKVIPNGVEADRCLPMIGRDSQRELWGVAGEEVVCLFAGRLSGEKNAEALIDALTVLPENYTALFVGEGPLRDQLVNRATRSASGRCRFLDARPQLGDCFAAADVFVLPSDCEGDSLAMKEAMIAGLPVVASDAGSVVELNEQFGDIIIQIPRRPRPEELAAAIQQAARAPAAALSWIQSIALKNFTISRIAREWEGFLETIAFEGRRRRMELIHRERMSALQATPIKHVYSPRDLGDAS